MVRKVPHDVDYIRINKISDTAFGLLCISAFFSISIILVEKTSWFTNKSSLTQILNSILAIISLVYFILDITQNYLFQQAELTRKTDFIDNSLKTHLAEENSEGFFSNDEYAPGIIKLGLNSFENTFFSKSIAYKMILPMIIKSSIIILLTLLVIFYTSQSIIISFFQIALPFTILQQTIRLLVFHSRLKTIYSTFKQIFQSTEKEKKADLLLDNTLNYEKTLSWAGISLSSKIFKKNNTVLSAKWNELKQEFK